MKFWERVNQYPPIACRIFARHKFGRPMSSKEIAVASGLTILRVEAISELTSWKGVDVLEMQAFTEACGMDFTSARVMKRFDYYVARSPKFLHLRKSELWEDYYKKLLKRWMEHYYANRKSH